MNKVEFLGELEKYSKVRDSTFQGPSCSPIQYDITENCILFKCSIFILSEIERKRNKRNNF